MEYWPNFSGCMIKFTGNIERVHHGPCKIVDLPYIPFDKLLTIVAMFISNGLLCAPRSAKMNLIEKQNILREKWNKKKKILDSDRKKSLF